MILLDKFTLNKKGLIMHDYKQLYIKLFGATEDAIQRLIEVQRECEEIIISSDDIYIHENDNQNHQLNWWFEQAL